MSSERGASSEAPFSVSDYLEEIATILTPELGRSRQRWIRAELVKSPFEKKHLYLDLKDASGDDAQIRAKCWETTWAPISRRLRDEGITLSAGSVINFCGYIDIYKARGEMSVVITKIDVDGMLGESARALQELIKKLTAEGVLEANKERVLADLPLRVGLIASPQTEGYKDFLGQLERSGLAFEVSVVPTTVQGEAAPPAIAAALRQLDALDLDLICVIRGGGSKADLACFDDELVARTIGASRLPVWTGIGHTGDTSVADMAAHTMAITPTALGAALVERASSAVEQGLREPARRMLLAVSDVLGDATQLVQSARREILSTARNRLMAEQRSLDHAGATMVRAARHVLTASTERLTSTRQLLSAYDPQRRLDQGWAIVTGPDGAAVTSINQVAMGLGITVRVSDGTLEATVTEKKGATHG